MENSGVEEGVAPTSEKDGLADLQIATHELGSSVKAEDVPVLTFSDELPSNCPLEGAATYEGLVYLACRTVSDDDPGFRTASERGAHRSAKGDDLCMTYGLSVFLDEAVCRHFVATMPFLRGKAVARGVIGHEHGVIKNTPRKDPEHHTWWPYAGISRSQTFSITQHVANQ